MTAHTPVPLPQKSSGKEAPSQQGPRGHQHPRPPARFRPLRNHTTHPRQPRPERQGHALTGCPIRRQDARPAWKQTAYAPAHKPPPGRPPLSRAAYGRQPLPVRLCRRPATARTAGPGYLPGPGQPSHRLSIGVTKPPRTANCARTGGPATSRPQSPHYPNPHHHPRPPPPRPCRPAPATTHRTGPYSAGAAVVVVKPWKWPLSTCPAIASSEASENGFSTKATLGSSLPWEARAGRA